MKQKNGASYDLLQEVTYNSAHQPLTVTDAARQTTTYTYTAEGQLETVTTPPRTGITENRTTSFDYDEDGYLESATRPAGGATTSYTYDSYGRTRTATDSDGYTLTYDQDALDRLTKVTYPDSTYEETVYKRLDPVRSRDRLGRWTHRIYDALRRVTATVDPLGRTVSQQWCSCGSLEVIIDANGNATKWERDIQGRMTKEIRANDSEWVYEYENTTSRMKTLTDPKEQVKTYAYFVDDNLSDVTYANEEHDTPDVSFSYDPVYERVATTEDGTGTTTYAYYPVETTGSLGAGMLAAVDGPFTNDVIAYAYDELGRVTYQAIDDDSLTYEYDALGRIIRENNVLGTFTYQYDGVTSRIHTVIYPNSQASIYAYYPNSEDHRLQEIHHKKPDGTTLSKFNYFYDVVGNVVTVTEQQESNPAKAFDFEYDRADQLRSAVWRTTDQTPTILKRYAYTYDPAGNRTVEQIDDAAVLSAYDNVNRMTSQMQGGTMRFAGTLNEAATVTIQGTPATVTSDNEFQGGAQVSSGTNQVVVKAKDYAGNERTNTYEVSVSGSSKTFTFDANGNMTGDGTRTFEWDAEDQLIGVNHGTHLTEFNYNGRGQRVRAVEKDSGIVTSDNRFVWCDGQLCEERDASGSTVLKTFYGRGILDGGVKYFKTLDRLGSVREMTSNAGVVAARYEYDPYGRRTQVGGTYDSTFGFTGHYIHLPTELALAPYRAYAADFGRWISEDPIGLGDGPNRYAYVRNNPTNLIDPTGKFCVPCAIVGGVIGGVLLFPPAANAPGPGDPTIPSDPGGGAMAGGAAGAAAGAAGAAGYAAAVAAVRAILRYAKKHCKVWCNFKLEKPDHYFPSMGNKFCWHLRVTCWYQGVKQAPFIDKQIPIPGLCYETKLGQGGR